jgi:membrane-bound serine protease (ClpP class)
MPLLDHIRSTIQRLPLRLTWFGLLALLMLPIGIGRPAHSAPTLQETSLAYVLTFEGAVTPVLAEYIGNSIQLALENDAEVIILQLDTPGGSVDVTKTITQRMQASTVPIVVYVAPEGAHAGSAGTFITLAGHVAAMAPNTSIGAASPVGGSGEDIGETMEAKVTNILSADIENLAERRGEKATEWAISAVREAAAATAGQALELGIVDFIAVDLDDLLTQMDSFEVTVNGESQILQTAGAEVEEIPLTPLQQFLNFISDPTIASLLLSLGILGLITEIRTPGFGVPGIIGVVSLLLAFYALGQLEANFAGLALIAVSVAFFLAEAFTPAFGILALGGAISFILGSVLLFNSTPIGVPWGTIIALAVGMAALTIFIGAKALAAQRRPPMTGIEGMTGHVAVARQGFGDEESGTVFLAGELWNARVAEGRIDEGDQVEIVGRDGYTLLVQRVVD